MMSGLLPQLLLYGLAAAAAAPIAAVVSALILGKSKTPLPSAFTFVAGAAALDVVIVGTFFALAASAIQGNDDLGAYLDIILGVLFAGLGVFAIFEKDSPEKDAKQRARADRVASGSLATLLLAGLAVQVINFDAIAVMAAGLKEIIEAAPPTAETIASVVFLLVLMLLPYWVPAASFAIAPGRARPALARMSEWIMVNSRMLEIVVGLGFGIVFLAKGVTALQG
jgi:threonine/homoserine/homoserine lactone efflux protein